MFDSFLTIECVRPFQSTLGAHEIPLSFKMAENVYKVIPLFPQKKYCIFRLVFPAEETKTTCLSIPQNHPKIPTKYPLKVRSILAPQNISFLRVTRP